MSLDQLTGLFAAGAAAGEWPPAPTRPCGRRGSLFAFPPAGITYRILTARRQAQTAVTGRALVDDASAGR